MRKPRILVVGSCNMDYTFGGDRFPEEGETVMGDSFSTAAGGKGANQACQAARAGAKVDFIGRIGQDANGTELMRGLSEMGIDTSMTILDPESTTGCALIELERHIEGTRNRIMVVPGAQIRFRDGELDFLRDRIGRYDMVLLQLEISMPANETVADMAKEAGVPVMLNPAPYAPMSRSFLQNVSFISPNEHEAAEMTGIAITDWESAEKAAAAIAESGPGNVLITMGEAGALLYYEGETVRVPSVKTEAVDPTAAGDSFVGAFCAAYAAGLAPDDSMIFASHAASLTVSGYGAQPSIPDINRIMKKLGDTASRFDCDALSRLTGGN